PNFVNSVRHLVFPFEMIQECGIHVPTRHAGGPGFVVNLIANDRRVVLKVTDDFPDHSLGVLPKVWIEKVVVLPRPVISGRKRWRIGWIIWIAERGRCSVARQKYFRVVLVKPGWN